MIQTLNEIHFGINAAIFGWNGTTVDPAEIFVFPDSNPGAKKAIPDIELADIKDFQACKVMKNIEINHFERVIDTIGNLFFSGGGSIGAASV